MRQELGRAAVLFIAGGLVCATGTAAQAFDWGRGAQFPMTDDGFLYVETVREVCDTPQDPSEACRALVIGLHNGFLAGAMFGEFYSCMPDDLSVDRLVPAYLDFLEAYSFDGDIAAIMMGWFIEDQGWGDFSGEACGLAFEDAAEPEPEPEQAEDPAVIAARVAAADPAVGADLMRNCRACHSAEQGAGHTVGPNLWGLFDRPIAGAADYTSYSTAFELYGQTEGDWTLTVLDAYLADPAAAVPGTKMAYAGMRDPEDRAALIAYLQTLTAQ